MMRDELLAFVRQRALIAPGDTVTCAVSGGADSMALLWALYGLRDALGITLRCAHYHHGLREQATQDAEFVCTFCETHQIEFECGYGDVAAQMLPGESLELAARRLRYEFLFRAARGGLLATAHTADDNLETLLLRLTRGTSPRGLGGIPVRRGTLIRPLLFATRAQVMDFLITEGVGHCEDASNATDFCPRNRMRHFVTPRLREENPAAAKAALALSEVMREEDAFLSQLSADALAAATEGSEYRCDVLNALPPVLRRRALFSVLQCSGVEAPTQRHLAQLEHLLASGCPSAHACFPGGVVLERRYDRLSIAKSPAQRIAPTPVKVPGLTWIPQAGVTLHCVFLEKNEKVINSPFTFALRCDMIDSSSLLLRSRCEGDRLTLSGGSRSLKRLMIDAKIPAAHRLRLPVLADRSGVVAVGGIGADVRRLAQSGEDAIKIHIEIEDTEHDG